MVECTIDVINQLGLHARAAAKLVKLAQKFESEILVERLGREVDAKSIMGVMMLAATCGTQVNFSIDGPDEQQAQEEITSLFSDRFGETA